MNAATEKIRQPRFLDGLNGQAQSTKLQFMLTNDSIYVLPSRYNYFIVYFTFP